jgi:opacity protein-like surface antigen
VSIAQLQGSLVYQFGGEQARLRPFVSAGLGAAIFGAPGLEGETKLSLGLGAGVKWLPISKVGARLQARYSPTRLNDASSDYCDPFGFCQSWLHQFELTGGVSFRF